MGEPLGHRVAAYFHAGMSPDPERRHKEVMRALQIADYDAWKAMESAREEVPEWWAVQMVHLEREIEEANKDYTPEGNFPECSSNLARENLEKGRWRLQRPPAVVYTVLGICCNSVAAVLVDAIYSDTRRQKYFGESMPYFAYKWGTCAHALGGGSCPLSRPRSRSERQGGPMLNLLMPAYEKRRKSRLHVYERVEDKLQPWARGH